MAPFKTLQNSVVFTEKAWDTFLQNSRLGRKIDLIIPLSKSSNNGILKKVALEEKAKFRQVTSILKPKLRLKAKKEERKKKNTSQKLRWKLINSLNSAISVDVIWMTFVTWKALHVSNLASAAAVKAEEAEAVVEIVIAPEEAVADPVSASEAVEEEAAASITVLEKVVATAVEEAEAEAAWKKQMLNYTVLEAEEAEEAPSVRFKRSLKDAKTCLGGGGGGSVGKTGSGDGIGMDRFGSGGGGTGGQSREAEHPGIFSLVKCIA